MINDNVMAVGCEAKVEPLEKTIGENSIMMQKAVDMISRINRHFFAVETKERENFEPSCYRDVVFYQNDMLCVLCNELARFMEFFGV